MSRIRAGRRERGGHEVLGDLVVLAAGEQDPVRVLDGSARAAHLLVVGDRRPGPLVVDDEAEVRLVEAHPQRDRRHQRLEPVREQVLLERLALLGIDVRVVGPGIDAPSAEPAGDPLRVGDREAVDDAGAWHRGQVLRQPGEPLGLVSQRDRVQVQRVAGQRSADDHHVVAELARDVLDHAVVGGRGRAQDRDVAGPATAGSGRCAGSRAGSRGPSRRCSAPRPRRTGRSSPGSRAAAAREVLVGEPLGEMSRTSMPSRRGRTRWPPTRRGCAELIVTARRPSRSAASIWLRIRRAAG